MAPLGVDFPAFWGDLGVQNRLFGLNFEVFEAFYRMPAIFLVLLVYSGFVWFCFLVILGCLCSAPALLCSSPALAPVSALLGQC